MAEYTCVTEKLSHNCDIAWLHVDHVRLWQKKSVSQGSCPIISWYCVVACMPCSAMIEETYTELYILLMYKMESLQSSIVTSLMDILCLRILYLYPGQLIWNKDFWEGFVTSMVLWNHQYLTMVQNLIRTLWFTLMLGQLINYILALEQHLTNYFYIHW